MYVCITSSRCYVIRQSCSHTGPEARRLRSQHIKSLACCPILATRQCRCSMITVVSPVVNKRRVHINCDTELVAISIRTYCIEKLMPRRTWKGENQQTHAVISTAVIARSPFIVKAGPVVGKQRSELHAKDQGCGMTPQAPSCMTSSLLASPLAPSPSCFMSSPPARIFVLTRSSTGPPGVQLTTFPSSSTNSHLKRLR
jgi:hypothetical protein